MPKKKRQDLYTSYIFVRKCSKKIKKKKKNLSIFVEDAEVASGGRLSVG